MLIFLPHVDKAPGPNRLLRSPMVGRIAQGARASSRSMCLCASGSRIAHCWRAQWKRLRDANHSGRPVVEWQGVGAQSMAQLPAKKRWDGPATRYDVSGGRLQSRERESVSHRFEWMSHAHSVSWPTVHREVNPAADDAVRYPAAVSDGIPTTGVQERQRLKVGRRAVVLLSEVEV